MAKELMDYLLTADKEYKFKVKIAGTLTEEQSKKLESVLSKYEIISFKGPKVTPVLKEPIDFPNIKNTEVSVFEATLQYPTTQDCLLNEIYTQCKLAKGQIVIRGNNESALEYMAEENRKSKLTDVDFKTDDVEDIQEKVGQARADGLVKNIPKTDAKGPKGDQADDFNKKVGGPSPYNNLSKKKRWNK